jgi:tetratricopeptide (TPR) repeat protein
MEQQSNKGSRRSFEKGLKLRRELVAAMPDSPEMNNRLAVLLIDYSAIPAFNFQAEKTLVLLNEALEIIQRMQRKDPENADSKKSMARALRIMSKAKGALGDYEGALNGLNTAVSLSVELAKQFPSDFRLQRAVWLTDLMICELYIDKGDGQKAVETCSRTIDFNRNVLQKEPASGVAAYDLAISYYNLARGFRLAENPTSAIENAEKAIDVMSKLVEKNPENIEYKRNIAIYEIEAARSFIKTSTTGSGDNQVTKSSVALKTGYRSG